MEFGDDSSSSSWARAHGEDSDAVRGGGFFPRNFAGDLSEESNSSLEVVLVTARVPKEATRLKVLPALVINSQNKREEESISVFQAPKKQDKEGLLGEGRPSVVIRCLNSGIDVTKLLDPKKTGLGAYCR